MTEKNFAKIFLSITIILAVFCITGCGQKEFKSLLKIKPSKIIPTEVPYVEICNAGPTEETDELLVTFAIDITGSNKQGPGGGSDPNRQNRYQNLLDWLDKRINSGIDLSHEFYALVEFSSQGIKKNGGIVNGIDRYDPNKPFMNINEFKTLVQGQMTASVDDNGTPYLDTLDALISILKDELKLRDKKYQEELLLNPKAKATIAQALAIWLSDGQPCTARDGEQFAGQGDSGCNLPKPPNTPPIIINVDTILDRVKDLVDVFPNDAVYGKFLKWSSLNTGFYQAPGVTNQYANKLLTDMATKGHGQFFDFSNGGKIDYDQVVRVETRKIKTDIVDWEIQNMNAFWNEDSGILELDSDADGVPDSQEFPVECKNKYSCNGSGIADGIYFRVTGKSCETEIDVATKQEVCRKDLVAKCCIAGKCIDQDGDGLLACEEAKLGTNDLKYDSNNDGIIDYTAFHRYYFITDESEITGIGPNFDFDQDGLTDYEELTHTLTPRRINNQDIPGLKPVERKNIKHTYDPIKGKSCDFYKIDNLPSVMPKKNDLMRVTIIDKQTSGAGEKKLRVAIKPLVHGKLTIHDSDFKSLVVK